MTRWGLAAIAYHLISRIAYAGGVGVLLRRQDRAQVFTRVAGIEAGFRRFRRIASLLMNNDAVSFALLCVATRRFSNPLAQPPIVLTAGALLVIVGVSTKLWAARTLGAQAYYWYDFFSPGAAHLPDPPGPYRYFRNPMYTVGYAHAYGFALLAGSWIGLGAAALDQCAILAFHLLVERPHLRRLLATPNAAR